MNLSVFRRLAAAAVAAALLSPASFAVAQDAVRIGFVNTERVLRDSGPARAATAKLEGEFSKRDKEIQDLGARLKTLAERLERDATVLQDSERTRRQREFADLERDLQRKTREFRDDLNQRRNEELSQVVEKVNRVIRQIAEQEKFDFILQEAVFASPRVDITDKVLRALANQK